MVELFVKDPGTLELFEGKWSDRYVSHSEADLALVRHLSNAGMNGGQVDRAFRLSKLMRPKWDSRRGKETYGERTLKRVMRPGQNRKE